MWHDYGGAGWGWMVFGMLVFWVLLIGICISLLMAISGGMPGRNTRPGRRTARDLLDERLARGELDVEEYRARCRALDGETG